MSGVWQAWTLKETKKTLSMTADDVATKDLRSACMLRYFDVTCLSLFEIGDVLLALGTTNKNITFENKQVFWPLRNYPFVIC